MVIALVVGGIVGDAAFMLSPQLTASPLLASDRIMS